MADILVIDDEECTRVILRAVLERAGHEVREASNGLAALTLYRQRRAAVVLCDIFMPDLDGLGTLRSLRHEHPGAVVISMSGGCARLPHDFLVHARMMGAVATLSKPIRPADLLLAVTNALEGGLAGQPAA